MSVNCMTTFEPPSYCPTLTKQTIKSYFALTRQQKRTFSWQSKNAILYPFLMPILYTDIDLSQIIIPHHELNDKFNKFFTSSFKLKTIGWVNEDVHNLNEVMIVTLDTEVHACQAVKRGGRGEDRNRKFSAIMVNKVVEAWKKVDFLNNMVKIWSKEQEEEGRVIYSDKNSVGRFKLEILKQDYKTKEKFVNQFLFCGSSPSFSIGCISVQRIKKGQNIKQIGERAFLIFEGSVIQEISPQIPNKKKTLNDKWKIQLVRGSLICKKQLKSILNNHQSDSFIHNYYALSDSTFLTFSYPDLIKILKTEKGTKKLLQQKIAQSESAHMEFIRKSLQAQQKIRQNQLKPIQYNYPITLNKKSKAFRKRSQNYEQNYQEFITFDKFEKMTRNKENVEKKHLIYSQLNNLLRQKEKEQRFVKKMNTEKGMKEIKKCQYQNRLKQTKIENLAIKDCIFNTQKYRDRPNDIKFIFQEEIMDKFIKGSTQSQKLRRHQKKYISMVIFQEDQKQSKIALTECKEQLIFSKKSKMTHNTRSENRSVKLVHCESTPDIFLTRGGPSPKKMVRIGSALNIAKGTNRFA